MKIRVCYFGPVRELIGHDGEEWEFEAQPQAHDVRSRLVERYPATAQLASSCRLAVNMAYVNEEELVPDGAEVAFIPPVAGG